jgi:hypothetical protein
VDYGPECVIELKNGLQVRGPVYPEPCSYIRVCDAEGTEIVYWNSDEMREDPEDVMGALLGAMKGGWRWVTEL